jgi:hypothetical protein
MYGRGGSILGICGGCYIKLVSVCATWRVPERKIGKSLLN